MSVPPTQSATPPAPPPAASSWVEEHRCAVWRYLRLLGASADEADDLSQETLLAGCVAERPPGERAGPFLRGIARNHWLRTRRWWRRRREREVALAVDELWSTTMEPNAGEDLLDQLRHCVQLLQPRARQALEMHYRDGLGWHDIAAQLGQKLNGTKTLAQRARQALRACIERRTT